ncbi:uncharacterized protein M421DRAFT_139430, partial [Didymella exigua CBS 183.55]
KFFEISFPSLASDFPNPLHKYSQNISQVSQFHNFSRLLTTSHHQKTFYRISLAYTMSTYARIAVAKQKIAESINHLCEDGHHVMAEQIRHENALAAFRHLPKIAGSPPQVYSPTSAPLHIKEPPKVSRLPASAARLLSTRQFEAMMDVPVHRTASTSRLTPTEQFEKILSDDLEIKTRAEVKRVTRWYKRW